MVQHENEDQSTALVVVGENLPAIIPVEVEADIVKVCNDFSNNMTEEIVKAFKIKNRNTSRFEFYHPATSELIDTKPFTADDYQTSLF